MSINPLVSIVIPTYYRNDWLKNCIDSVKKQTYENIEIIVVDDSGESHAKVVAEDHDLTYISHKKNIGGNGARNSGIAASDGEYIQLLDDDDQLEPTKIEKQVALLKSDPSLGVVYCGLQQENGTLVYPHQQNRGDVLAQALRISALHPCQTGTMLFRGDLLRELHPLKNREAGDDLGLKIRAAARTEFDFVDEILLIKGDSGGHRSAKIEFSNEIFNIIDEFDHLYDRFDARVRKDALVAAYQSRGTRLITQRPWSAMAILCFAKALYYSDSMNLELVGSLLSSLLGRRVYVTTREIYNLFKKKETRFN